MKFSVTDNICINEYLITYLTNTILNNRFKIIGKQFRSNKVHFCNKIVNIWNLLPTQIVNNNTFETFKKKLDKHLASVLRIEYFLRKNDYTAFYLFCFVVRVVAIVLVVVIDVDYTLFLFCSVSISYYMVSLPLRPASGGGSVG